MSDQSKIISWLKENARPGDRIVSGGYEYIMHTGGLSVYSASSRMIVGLNNVDWHSPEIWRKNDEQKCEAIGTPRINETWILVAKYTPPGEPEAWGELRGMVGIGDSRSGSDAHSERMEAAWPEIERRVAKMIKAHESEWHEL